MSVFNLYSNLLLRDYHLNQHEQGIKSAYKPLNLREYERLLQNHQDHQQYSNLFLAAQFDQLSLEIVLGVNCIHIDDKFGDSYLQDIFQLLQWIIDSCESTHTQNIFTFHLCRVKALYLFRSRDWLHIVSVLNTSISLSDGKNFGIVDVLLLISEAYSHLDKPTDSLHSAKLAVDIAHDQIQNDTTNKTIDIKLKSQLKKNHLLCLSYFALGQSLIATDMRETAAQWLERARQHATKLRLGHTVLKTIEEVLRAMSSPVDTTLGPLRINSENLAASLSPPPTHD